MKTVKIMLYTLLFVITYPRVKFRLFLEITKGCAVKKQTIGFTYSEIEYYTRQPPNFLWNKSYKRFMMENLNPYDERLNALMKKDLVAILKRASKHQKIWDKRSFLYSRPSYIGTLIEKYEKEDTRFSDYENYILYGGSKM